MWFFKPLTRPEQPEHSCRLQLLHGPISAEPYREKTRPLRPRRSCFAPAEALFGHDPEKWIPVFPRDKRRGVCAEIMPTEKALVESPGTAPGSEWFIATAIYFHSRRTGTLNIGGK